MTVKYGRFGAMLCVGIVALSILAGVGIYQHQRAEALELSVKNQYTHAFYELADYVQDVDFLLKKSMLTSGAASMSALSAEIYMKSAAAKANLAMLPVEQNNLTGISKFLSQVGDYTAHLAKRAIYEEEVSQAEYDMLSHLSEYAQNVSGEMQALREKLGDGQIYFDEKSPSAFAAFASDDISIGTGLEGIEKAFQDYPSLIYDGPFSEHIETMEPVMLKDKPDYSEFEARRVAADCVGKERSEQLVFVDDGGDSMPCYNFMAQREDGSTVTVSVTKQGGYVLHMLDSRTVFEKKLRLADAREKARSFLQKQGLFYMQESYYEESDHIATLNFAASQGKIVLYSDLVKVKVALDNGEIVGFEAKGYLMNHRVREVPESLLSMNEAKKTVSPRLVVTGTGLALIPKESRREVLCYEFMGEFNGNHYLVYVNAQTGKEEQILLLIESDSGVLTV